jgi:CheY-like chemotaxis protein
MPPEVQARIFEPFFTTKGDKGTGLGLAMVFGVIEAHGGHIRVHSKPGRGTVLRLSLPLASEAPASVPSSPALNSVSTAADPLRILAVDDEPMITRALHRLLRPAGHRVTVANSGEEAVDRLEQEQFDLMISDVGMGTGMTGWQLCDQVHRRWPHVRLVLATGWGAAIDMSEARAKGIEAVLAKPFSADDLERVLRAA